MPRNASGTYSLPSGNPVSSGTLIDANWANNTLNDLANEVTDSLSRSAEGGMLAPLRLTDGVQATPSLAFTNEPSSGLYRAGTNDAWFVSGGNQVMQFTSSGVVGRLAAGAVGTPSLTFFGDLNTGLWSPAADTLAASTGGSERLRVDSSGNVGIGTASPGQKLDVIGSGRSTGAWAVGDSSGNFSGSISNESDASKSVTFAADPGNAGANSFMRFNVDGSERARIDSSGNLGIGTIPSAWRSGARALQLGVNGYVSLFEQANGAANLTFAAYESAANTFAYRTTGDAPTLYSQVGGVHTWSNASSGTAGNTFSFTERMRLDTSGNLGIGTASPATRLHIDGAFRSVSSVTGPLANLFTSATNPASSGASGNGLNLGYDNNGEVAWIQANRNSISETRPLLLNPNGGSVAAGASSLATNATDGFLYVPTCAGTPTGTPAAITGMAPIVVNTTNNKLYFYSGGAWRDAGP